MTAVTIPQDAGGQVHNGGNGGESAFT